MCGTKAAEKSLSAVIMTIRTRATSATIERQTGEVRSTHSIQCTVARSHLFSSVHRQSHLRLCFIHLCFGRRDDDRSGGVALACPSIAFPCPTACVSDMSKSFTMEDDVVEELRSAASVASFESTDLATYRATLTRALRATVVRMVSRQHGWSHYEGSVDSILYDGLPWSELLAYSRRRSQQASTDMITPLEEVASGLINPCIIPHALSSSIAMILFRVLVEDATAMTSVSESPLLQALRQLLKSRPSIRRMGSELHAYIQSNLRLQVDMVDSYDVESAHRLVSVCKHLASFMDGAAILKCLLTLLQSIDDVDVKLLQTRRKKARNESSLCLCNNNSGRRLRNTRAFDLENDLQEGQDTSGLAVSTFQVTGGGLIVRVSRLSQRYSAIECDMCRLQKSSQGITQLSIQLVLLRSRVCNKVLSIFSSVCAKNADNNLCGKRHVTGPNVLLSSVIHNACQHPETASSRLCVVLVADSLSSRGYNDSVQCLWLLYNEREATLGEAVLRIYSEFLVESSYFDQLDRFWDALQPLLNHVAELCSSKLSSPEELKFVSRSRVQLVLRCLSFLLCRRRHILASFEAVKKWQDIVSKLSITFEAKEWWVSDGMSQVEMDETLSALQAVGILGFLTTNDLPSVGKEAGKELVQNQRTWPFPESTSLRSAHRRMGPNLGREGVLSNMCRAADGPSTLVPPRGKRSDDRTIGTPIMSYLNEDLLRTVFSFLGYRRLVKASGICKAWKSLTEEDALWCQAYRTKFPVLKEEEPLIKSINKGDSPLGSWKTLLVNKMLAEKALRFKRHSSGWKHRTCGHIGCLMVLKNPNQMTTHYRTHMKRRQTQIKQKRFRGKRKLSEGQILEQSPKRFRRCEEGTRVRNVLSSYAKINSNIN